MKPTTVTSPTPETYDVLRRAYDHFNATLFAGQLPPCLITLQRQRGAYGYFSGGRFVAKTGAKVSGGTVHRATDEIALNPNHLGERDDTANLSTLAHEMCHLWQHHFGKQPRRAYHDRQWAAKMKEIGLQPTDSGLIGGKETGQKVTHIIVKGGAFDHSCAALLKTGLQITWHDPHSDAPAAKKKNNTRSKYTCPECQLAAWAKPKAPLGCTDCEVDMVEEVQDSDD